MSEDDQDDSNNLFTRKDKRVTAEWNPVTDRITATETSTDGTISKKEYEVVRDDFSRNKKASRNDTVADFNRNRVHLREVSSNASTDTAKQTDTKEDTSDSS